MYGDALKEIREIPFANVVKSTIQNVKNVPTGAGDGGATSETSIPAGEQVKKLKFVLQSEMNSGRA